ncbi:MAG: GPR endopeptidase [Ruminiclostridium sp.]|nr:GPR endopeptidase [Ruminiclostridium sp.]
MTNGRKIDLALEAKEFAEGSAEKTSRLSGIRAVEDTLFGLPLTRVEILDERGEAALGKPKGTYLTLDLPQLPRDREEILKTARAVAAMMEELPVFPREGLVLVTGLGNRQITPDAIGPKTIDALLVTRHLVESLPGQFGDLRPVAALAAGVTGTTGMESGEIIGAVIKKLRPVCLVAVDALAARRQERVCRTIQVADTGIVPGSGVGNARMALDRASLGIPVIAVGIPTVVDAGTLCMDLLEENGQDFDPSAFRTEGAEWFVTPRNVDNQVAVLSRILGLGISTALHVDFSVEDVDKWTS